MTKNKIFSTLLTLSLIFACSSDDDNSDNSNSSEILGKWVITQLDFEDNYLNPECAVNNNTHEYLSNGNLIYDYTTGNNCTQTGTINFEYSFEDNNKLVKTTPNGGLNPENDYVEKYTIKSLTEEELILEAYYVDEGVDNGAGIINIAVEDRREEIWARIN
ncbi:hypothetical protein OAC97_03965 [Flavobacteriaceae bacterium]|nr:hypothetical protein [Flavobacteriaceae bacterium]